MSYTKMQEYEVFKALSEPIRLRIVALLMAGELCVCDLTSVLEMPQSTISRHMNRLKISGLVTDRRAGKWVHYSLDLGFTGTFPEFAGLFQALGAKEPYRSDLDELRQYKDTKGCAE